MLYRFIMDGGFPVEHKIDCYTLIQFAVVYAGGFEVIQCLLQCGADLARKTMNGRNVVHLACRANRPWMLQALWPYLEHFNITHYLFERTHGGVTPMMMAIQTG